MTTLFISDLHLAQARPDMTAAFINLLQGEAKNADALYILGDLFESWIGDDVSLQDHPEAIAGLKALSDGGVPIFVICGNRDFLLGNAFETATGSELLEDGSVIDLYGEKVTVLHGDLLCTDDIAYQRFRRFAHNKTIQKAFLGLPTAWRRNVALWLRGKSQRKQAEYTPPEQNRITDVNSQAVAEHFSRSNVRLMIHGHTHRPKIHQHEIDGVAHTRIVLGDWYEQASVLHWPASNDYRLESSALET